MPRRQAAKTIQFTVGNAAWNATDACCGFFSAGTNGTGVLRGLIEEMRAAVRHGCKASGLISHSGGGFMAYWMPCQSADRTTGIASLAGYAFLEPTRCPLLQPIKFLHLQGIAKPLLFTLEASPSPLPIYLKLPARCKPSRPERSITVPRSWSWTLRLHSTLQRIWWSPTWFSRVLPTLRPVAPSNCGPFWAEAIARNCPRD